MKNIDLKNFSEFESWIEQFHADQADARQKNPLFFSDLLFRGHADANWPLVTTLERECPNVSSINDYLHSANRVKLQVELYSGRKWDPILDKNKNIIQDESRLDISRQLPSLEYLVYLRHHGFPSPLLDWTRSPYIAALFAYTGQGDKDSDEIAIFVHQHYTGDFPKVPSPDDPVIHSIGPYIDTHKRHSVQQAQYTLCLNNIGYLLGRDQSIQSHEEYRQKNPKQLQKITLPKSEKNKILAKLDQFNLNLHTLYGSEESLMTTLALREFHLK